MVALLSLPPEILDHVCYDLSTEWPPSTCDLSLANKQCYAAAGKHRFHHITFALATRKKLREEISEFTTILERNSAFGSVWSLRITGHLPPVAHENNQTVPGDRSDPPAGDTEDEWIHTFKDYWWSNSGFSDECGQRDNDTYRPMAGLLGRMQALKVLIWASGNQVPPCLLEVLHTRIPRCKLNLMAFNLQSLHYRNDQPRDIDEHEYSLATSPSLSRLAACITYYDGGGKVEYNQEAIHDLLVRRLAPNLKYVDVLHDRPVASPSSVLALRRGRPRWRGFVIDDPKEQGESNTLPLEGFSLQPAYHYNFKHWQRCISFSQLRRLHLQQVQLETMAALVQCQFPSLKVLVLDLRAFRDATHDGGGVLDQAGSRFVSGLPPLTSAEISGGPCEKTIDALLGHHGLSLSRLSLLGNTSLAKDRIELVKTHCSNLRHLTLSIPRSVGDRDEVAIYRAIAQLPQLTDLSLRLECREKEEWMLMRERFISQRKPWEYPELLEATYINAAVDESLACAIFITIVDGSSSPLQRLNVEPEKFSVPTPAGDHLDHMRRRLKVLRIPTPEGYRLVVREIGRRAREQFNERRVELGDCEPVFRKLWPAKSDNWTNDWHSFGLASD